MMSDVTYTFTLLGTLAVGVAIAGAAGWLRRRMSTGGRAGGQRRD